MFAFEIATLVRNVSELDRRSVLFLIASTLPPLIVKMGSGLTLVCTCELVVEPESVRSMFLYDIDERDRNVKLRVKGRTSQSRCSRRGTQSARNRSL